MRLTTSVPASLYPTPPVPGDQVPVVYTHTQVMVGRVISAELIDDQLQLELEVPALDVAAWGASPPPRRHVLGYRSSGRLTGPDTRS